MFSSSCGTRAVSLRARTPFVRGPDESRFVVVTDAPGSGRVQVSRSVGGRGDVPRDDVAVVLLECLQAPNTVGVEFELFEGDVPAGEAVRSL